MTKEERDALRVEIKEDGLRRVLIDAGNLEALLDAADERDALLRNSVTAKDLARAEVFRSLRYDPANRTYYITEVEAHADPKLSAGLLALRRAGMETR